MTSQTPRSPTGPLASPKMLAVLAAVLNAPAVAAVWWAYTTASQFDR